MGVQKNSRGVRFESSFSLLPVIFGSNKVLAAALVLLADVVYSWEPWHLPPPLRQAILSLLVGSTVVLIVYLRANYLAPFQRMAFPLLLGSVLALLTYFCIDYVLAHRYVVFLLLLTLTLALLVVFLLDYLGVIEAAELFQYSSLLSEKPIPFRIRRALIECAKCACLAFIAALAAEALVSLSLHTANVSRRLEMLELLASFLLLDYAFLKMFRVIKLSHRYLVP